ncbi:MAG: hypothetical protein JWM95_4964 [Gemmatimonadetes bacterium]|nr:hypothetical protein [Gemmatimonadota bacterium]
MTRAFAYLILVSMRNRFVSQVKRIRNPRYALALLLGLGYFWMMFFNRGMRAPGGRQGLNLFAGMGASTVLPLILLLLTAYAWITGGDKYALAFTEAEVSVLFPAPISRRGLIVYKLVRSQTAVLFTSLVWSMLFRSGKGGAIGIVSYWIMLSIITLHRLGVALIFASSAEHGVRGLRRSWPAIAAFGVVATVIVNGLLGLRTSFASATGMGEMMDIAARGLSTGIVGWALYPFRVAVGPMVATTTAEWLAALGPALVLVGLHVWWVLRTDSAFEETAAAASAAQAQRIRAMRARGVSSGTVSVKAARRTVGLRPTGAPAVALLWKNVLWLSRTGQVRTLVGLPVIACVAAVGFAGGHADLEPMVAILSAIMAATVLLFGPMTMRNDLRGELRRLPMLKTLPLTGRQIILAEVASSATPTAAVQYVLIAAAILALSFASTGVPALGLRIGVLIGAPFFLLGLNLANFTIHNGMALLFPAWVRLGELGGSGVEVMGQMMLTMLATLLMLLLLLVAPAVAAGAAYFALQSLPVAAIGGAGLAGGAALCAEAYGLMAMLGSSLERLEPMQLG